MQRVYSSYDLIAVHHARNLLEAEGIRAEVRNERLSSAMGELPPAECQAEVWVLEARDAQRAERLLRSQQQLQQVSAELTLKTDALGVTLDSMAQGMLTLGADGRVDFFNQRLVELADLPESFLTARPTMDDISRNMGWNVLAMDATANWDGLVGSDKVHNSAIVVYPQSTPSPYADPSKRMVSL